MTKKKFILAIDHDFRNKDYPCKKGLITLINNPKVEIRFLSKEGKTGRIQSEDLKDVDFFIATLRAIDEESLAEASRLKWIGRLGAGFEKIDIDTCTKKGILVSNAPQGLKESVAENVVAYIYALNCKLKFLDERVREYGFENKEKYLRFNLFKKVIGVIGFGGIAIRVIELLKPLNMECLVYDPYVDGRKVKEKGCEKVDLDTLLKRSDLISLHVPLTEETREMLGEADFKKMKRDAYFINTSRGGIYRDEVLAKALNNGYIAGAGIDVFEDEPHVENNPLLKIKNTILTPHTSGATNCIDSQHNTEEIIVNSVLSLLEGKWPFNILNPEAVKADIPDKYLSTSFFA